MECNKKTIITIVFFCFFIMIMSIIPFEKLNYNFYESLEYMFALILFILSWIFMVF